MSNQKFKVGQRVWVINEKFLDNGMPLVRAATLTATNSLGDMDYYCVVIDGDPTMKESSWWGGDLYVNEEEAIQFGREVVRGLIEEVEKEIEGSNKRLNALRFVLGGE